MISELINEITYGRYARNRDEAPAITPNSWKHVYGDSVDEMEARYQAEKAIRNAARTSNDHSNAVGGDARASGGTNS